MNKAFEEGFNYIGGAIGSEVGSQYISNINDKINELANSIKKFEGYNTSTAQLKGDIFEMWHAGTYNIDSAIKSSNSSAEVIRSHKFASPDIQTSWNDDYGLKNYSDYESVAKAQAISYKQYFNDKSEMDLKLLEEYLTEKGIKINDPIYEGQKRLIPSDQIDDAIKWLKRKVQEESVKRPELAHKYQETLDNIVDRIKGPKNTESIPIDKNTSVDITNDAKKGDFDPSDYGITTEELVKLKYILEQSVKAGTTAAAITFTLKIAPEIIKIVRKVINDEHISQKDLEKFGIDCISTTGKSFINGTISATITASLKAGLAGEMAKKINPIIIGTATTIAINSFSNAIKMASGKMSQAEFGEACTRDIFIATISTGGAIFAQSFLPIPYVGALIGNVLGGVIGSVVYPVYRNAFLSFCADTGYTFLGFVEQDYTLPIEVLREMGMDIVAPDECQIDESQIDECKPDECKLDECVPDKMDQFFIKRGIIGTNRIGYIAM